tara:strand:+ start:627 stop:1013 length:387 start_codon:yes stop_codon:yes gene_type:complete
MRRKLQMDRLNDATRFDWDRIRNRESDHRDTIINRYVEAAEEEQDRMDNRMLEAHSEDVVNNPAHYNAGGIECIEAIEASMSVEAFEGYLKGNCLKYLWRMSYKGKALEDTKKAQWYLQKLIDSIEES